MGPATSPTPRKVRQQPLPEARKEARQTGKSYVTRKGKTIADKVFKMIPCNCKHQCKSIPLEKRKNIFKKFWSSGSWQVRSNFILQTVQMSKPERSIGPKSRKQMSRIYSLDGQRVCKPVYLGTLAISHTRVNYCLNHKGKDGLCSPDKRGKKTPANKTSSSAGNHIMNFLDAYPKYVSHYNNSQKHYFSPNTSIKKLHSEYLSKFPAYPVSFTIFQREFKKMNVNIYKPKTDTCQKCDYLQQNISKTEDIPTKDNLIKERDIHHAKAKRAREELKSATANESLNVLAFTFDMQKIQPIPFIQTSTVYFKRQLSIYNLGINTQARIQGGAFGARAPPLEPNAQTKKSTEIKRLEGADSAKISKIFKMNFFFCLRHSLKSTLQFGIRKNVICERKVCSSAAPPMRLLFLVQTDF